MNPLRLEDVIRRYVPLSSKPNSRGFYSVLCKVCGDHGRKGKRAGFKFDNDTVGFNCFNCGHSAIYDPHSLSSDNHASLSDNMITVLESFNIPDNEWKQVLFTNLALQHNEGHQRQTKLIHTDIEPKEIEVPSHFYPLGSADSEDKWTIIARDYLEHERGVDPDKYRFYLSTGEGDPSAKKWKGRLIIPIYKDNKLIFYQGRALVTLKKKYESPNTPRDRVICGFDELFKHTEAPLYITEGWFDAEAIGGVAVLGNKLSDAQIKWLNRSNRPKVIVPDRFGDGHLLAEQGVNLGWKVSIPDTASCKDVSEAVKKYGKLYVMNSLVENTVSDLMARMAIEVHCKHGQDRSKKKNKNSRSGKGKR